MQNFKLKIIGNDSEYNIEENLSVLESALNNNIVIPYGCKNGQCGSCRGQVVDGKVTLNKYSSIHNINKRSRKGLDPFLPS